MGGFEEPEVSAQGSFKKTDPVAGNDLLLQGTLVFPENLPHLHALLHMNLTAAKDVSSAVNTIPFLWRK